jgi:hypothetical protein
MRLIGQIGLIILAAICFCGCGQSSDQRQIDELKTRLALVESNSAYLSDEIEKRRQDILIFKAFNTTMGTDMQSNLLDIADLKLQSGVQQMQLDLLTTIVTNSLMRPQVAQGYRVPRYASPEINGVPADIYNGIRAAAQEKWPDNYDMQVYEINKQVTAYKQLHGQ